MLNHLDDPDPHSYPDDFRDRVKARARTLRSRRRVAILGASVVAVVALGAAGLYGRAFMGLDDVDRLTVAGTGEPTGEEPHAQHETLAEGDPAPALASSSLNGDDFDLRSHRGRHVVLAMTASWCVPCIEDSADLLEFSNRRPEVTVVSAAVSDDPQRAVQLHEDAGASWPLLNDTDGEIARRYHLPRMPAYVIVRPDGTIGATVFGSITPDELDDLTR